MSKKAQKVQEDIRCKGIRGNTSKAEIKCVCLNARSIINKKNELNIMVDDIKPHIHVDCCEVTDRRVDVGFGQILYIFTSFTVLVDSSSSF